MEKTLESLLDSKEIKPVSPKEKQAWTFIGKDPDAGKYWRKEEKGATEDEMVVIVYISLSFLKLLSV